MSPKKYSMLGIHIAVLLFGLAGLFGKWLALPPQIIVFGRTCFASLTLGAILFYTKTSPRTTSRRDQVALIMLGGVLALHWVAFFHAIQVSTVAVGLLTFSTFPLFVTFMEPYVFNEKLRRFDMLTAGLVLLGLILVVPSFDFRNNIFLGAFWGTISGFTFAVLVILNRKYVAAYSSNVIVFYQNCVATILLLPFLFFEDVLFRPSDIVLLAVLGVFCTAMAHALFTRGLILVKAQLASIIAGLEPVYGIIFAFLFLGEVPAPRTILGGSVILGTITLSTIKRHADN